MQGATEAAKAKRWRVQIRPSSPSPTGLVYAREWENTDEHGFKTFEDEEEAKKFAGAFACPARAVPVE